MKATWWRGGAVLLLVSGVLAAALMSPAAAGRFATKAFVNRKIDNVSDRLAEVADVNHLIYIQGPQVTLGGGDTGRSEAVCPPGSFVAGGGGGAQLGDGTTIDSYPSNGTGFPASGRAAIGNIGWVFEYEAAPSTPETIRAYAICSRVDSTSGFTGGAPPG